MIFFIFVQLYTAILFVASNIITINSNGVVFDIENTIVVIIIIIF